MFTQEGIKVRDEIRKLLLNSRPPPERKRACECGYDPEEKSKSTDAKCPINLPLFNHITFPSFKMLPEKEEVKELYYNKEGSPKVHWCLFFEIEETIDDHTWSGISSFGEKMTLELKREKDEKPTTFDWSELIKGNTVAILYAEKEKSKVVEECLDYCYVFKASIEELFDEVTKLLVNADLTAKNKPSACFGCGEDTEKVSRCSVCLLAKYCSRECQRKDWKGMHKKLCPQSETLLRLASLPRRPFEKHFDFTFNQEDSLPPYIHKEEFVFFDTNPASGAVLANARCGLCNLTNAESLKKKGYNLIKTECCKQWVCDDEHTYQMFSYARNSCARSHRKYTICGFHFVEGHKGKWQDCDQCKGSFSKADYAEAAFNSHNFPDEKLKINKTSMKR